MFKKKKILSTDLSTVIPHKTQVFLIIVHFGDPQPTTDLINTLLKGANIPHIVVVDHANLPYHHPSPQIQCIRPKENNGYFAGLQYGIDATNQYRPHDTDLYILCNNDLEMSPTTVEMIVEWWNAQGTTNTLAGPFIGALSLLSGRAHINSQKSIVTKPYIHGACIIAPYTLVAQLPLTKLFLYWEDVGLSLLAQSRGVVLRQIPSCDIRHEEEVDAPLSSEKLYYLVRNGAFILERYTGDVWSIYWFVINRMRFVYHSSMHTKKHALIVKALKDSWTMKID